MLAILVVSQLMFVLDTTVVNIALPDMQSDLDFSPTGLSWVINAYTLAFGGLLLLGGRAGDILGRRRVFFAGITLFTAASLLGGLAQTSEWLLVARAAQGVGCALASPTALALITTNFKEGPERTKAFGLYTAVSGAGMAFGLVVGGLLTEWASWRWVFFINVPVGVLLMLLTPKHVVESERNPGRFDLSGALTSTIGVTALVYGFIRAAEKDWSEGGTITALVVGVLVLGAFVVVESRARQPITPLRMFTDRNRAGSYAVMLFLVASMLSLWFFITQFLQEVLEFGPIKAGLAFLPLSVAILGCSGVASKAIEKVPAKALMGLGALVMLSGMLWLTQISSDTGYAGGVLGPMVLVGGGLGLVFVPVTVTALSDVRPEDSGAASGLVNVMQQVGGSLGLSILVTVFGSAAKDSAKNVPAGSTTDEAAKFVLSDAMGTTFVAGVGFTAALLVISLLVIKTRPPAAPDAGDDAHGDEVPSTADSAPTPAV
ncbi:MFS transporter [Yinghuangia sp. ASG 101]|nr:MFS transporter [Yinghuangia sp. ASG 101]UGQ12402.1 MFS transporter [Yinghuangia sp. ASG 101]